MVCLSHLRWDFVFQRPQHLITRFAREHRVFYVEEPRQGSPSLEITHRPGEPYIVVPHVPAECSPATADALQCLLLDGLFRQYRIRDYLLWYYTPMALGFTRQLTDARAVVYDCMDELSAFRGAPPELMLRETELFRRADLVFTGGQSLYEAKRREHPRVAPFPSSVDVPHFRRARQLQAAPPDQACIPSPRLGFYGVIDERLDLTLLADLADARPEWQIVLIGPTAKIDPATLPRRPNLHYLGSKAYADLPAYLAGWDVALLPFARNEATRFISPTKTPEYLAAGCAVVSTGIQDVVRPYGTEGLVHVADDAEGFVTAIELALSEDMPARQARTDAFLAGMSWDATWQRMCEMIDAVTGLRQQAA
jgi:glycosyltransferase involved in cell wall biosynthesis